MNHAIYKQVATCIHRINLGDRDAAVMDLYALMGNTIRFVAVRIVRYEEDVEDVVQDFWANIVNYCAHWHGGNAFYYLRRCMENLCKNRLRSISRRPEQLSLGDLDSYEDGVDNEELTTFRLALQECVRKAEGRMTPMQRKVFVLSVIEDRTVREIADLLGLSRSAAGRLHKEAMDIVKNTFIADGWDKDGF